MNQLEQARIEINKIDEQMAVLFERRMQACLFLIKPGSRR